MSGKSSIIYYHTIVSAVISHFVRVLSFLKCLLKLNKSIFQPGTVCQTGSSQECIIYNPMKDKVCTRVKLNLLYKNVSYPEFILPSSIFFFASFCTSELYKYTYVTQNYRNK